MKPLSILALFGSMVAGALVAVVNGQDWTTMLIFAAIGPVVLIGVRRIWADEDAKKPPANPGERVSGRRMDDL